MAAYGLAEVPYVAFYANWEFVGAYEWRKKGVAIPVLQHRIHPHYGVFSPVRGEYVELVAQAPLPQALRQNNRAFDIGTGTGVLWLSLHSAVSSV